MPETFLDAIRSRVLVGDGATATMFYEKGVLINRCYEELNLTQPDMVRDLHREYIKAGADLIQTNTFAANRFKLRRFGLEEKVGEINKAGVALAREESRGAVFVAGDVGPLGPSLEPIGIVTRDVARDAYREQIGALLEGKPDLLVFETFHDVDELELAIGVARSIDPAIAIVAQVAFEEGGATLLGATPEQVAIRLEAAGADVIGANCSTGPSHMLATVERMIAATRLPVSAQPNAGMPERLDDRLVYLTTPEYLMTFGKRFIRAGARLVGGCCGTTPRHIALLKGAALALSPSRVEVKERKDDPLLSEAVAPVPTAEKSPFAAKLAEGRWVQSVELLPPKGADPEKIIIAARTLHAAGIDCINIPDGPRAMARMNPLSLAILLRQDPGIEPIIHYTCRDKNLLGMQSDILGAHAVGVRNILAITGDPPKLGNYPDATAVYDVDAIGLVKMIRNLNRGLDIVGNPIQGQSAIHIGVGANPGALNFDEEIRRFEQKVEAGAEYCMTQPVFELPLLEKFLRRIEPFRIPVLVGILPLASYRSAEFLHNEVPGMQIPEAIRARLRDAGEGARSVGVEIARNALDACRSSVEGVYVMAPVGGAATALAVLNP
ncbi:MAG: bifunctional homocysteine S-methyltransferase/methylenetetrahydrofolate reductase [Nitrospinae bacterium]|nr:bifunctional homocysteine S-methyltransferase/methylenetetrahydrofolate reductase [Nitrospinota bacterium]